ncbi:hypothetical protein AeRB84_019979 [Aphanomyces euteiches]|nr:hypothetical protein AeRB84_019979 [Aphanomyces euteiches]
METPPPKRGRRWNMETPQKDRDDDILSDATPFNSPAPSDRTFAADNDENEGTFAFDEEEEENDVQFVQQNKVGFGKRVRKITASGFRMLVEILNYTWFLLPFLCLIVALVLPRYLITAIQASPTSLTSPGRAASFSTIQVQMDTIIKDISSFKKFQQEQEARIEEITFLYEQSSKNIDTLLDRARTSTGDIPTSVLDHVSEMIQAAVKKSTRELKNEYKTALQPLETGLRQITTQASLFENDLKTYKTLVEDVEELVESNKKHVLEAVQDATNPQATEQKVSAIVSAEIALVQDKMTRLLTDEATRLEHKHSQALQTLRNSTLSHIDQLVGQSAGQAHTFPSKAIIDYASSSSGARVLRFQRHKVKPPPQSNLLSISLFSESPFTSKTFNAFPLCSILGSSCPLLNQHPESAITDNVDPGNCWTMEGASGSLSVKLAYPIVPQSVEIYHIDPSIAVDFGSAPKDIQVIGLVLDDKSKDVRHVNFGSFQYLKNGGTSQRFFLNDQASTPKVVGMTLRCLWLTFF